MHAIVKMLRAFPNTLALIGGICAFMISYLLRLSLPKTRGTISAEGLDGAVEIIRDAWGVPHIFAKTLRDAFFGCGIVHAQDRLWQLELWRRTASGTLSEIVGERTLAADRFMRRLGLRRLAEQQLPALPDDNQMALQAYSAGVNTVLGAMPWWRLPVEFLLFRFRPKPWTPEDSATVVKLVGVLFSPNWDAQIVRLWLIERLGPQIAASLEPQHIDPYLITPKPEVSLDRKDMAILEEYADVSSWLSSEWLASNTWAVSGAKTLSGKPIFANDVHTPPAMPSFWYELHLITPEHNIIGVAIPGFPGIIAGRNRHIAWGLSVGLANQQSVFVEKLNPDNPNQYLYDGAWRDGQVITETIPVRGRYPERENILITHHGPVIGPLIPRARRALALKSVALESLGILTSAAKLMVASNFDEFREALSFWSCPSVNVVYADRKGHIGWQFAGSIPARSGSGLVPGRGWTKQDEWIGYVPYTALPSVFDPDSHVVAAANNMPSDKPFFHISGEWADPYRIRRITEFLEARTNLTARDFAALHADVYSSVADEILPFVVNLKTDDPALRWAIGELRQWNRQVRKESIATALFEVFAYKLYRNIFAEKLGDDLDYYLGKGIHVVAHINALGYRAASNLARILRSLPDDWFSPGHNGTLRTLTDVIKQSLEEATAYLTETAGKDKQQWQWGRIHKTTFRHALGKTPLLRRLLNVGPFPLDGDMNTVPQASYDPVQPFHATASVVTWRHITDFSDASQSLSVLPPGESGQPASTHARDQAALWLDTAYHPLFFDEKLVRMHAKDILRIEPRPFKK